MSSHSHTHTHGAGAHDHSSEDHHHSHSHVAQGGADHASEAHGHSGDSTAAANRAHYDERAAEQSKTKAFIDLANRNAPYILGQYAFDKESTTVLDFACGTGLTSRSVAPYAKRVVGVDISPVSIEHYNKFAQEVGYTPEQMHGLALELKGEPGELDGATFDVVVCSMAYHHMDDIHRITRVLERFVKPGGALIIVDLNATPEGKEIVKEEYHHVVPHVKGFTEAQIRQTFEGVGLTSFVFKDAGFFEWEDKHLDLFVAKGIKPNTA